MVDVTAAVRARVLEHFRNSGDPAEASVTFLGADRIIVLDGGRIVQDGSPERLTHVEGFYRELIRKESMSHALAAA